MCGIFGMIRNPDAVYPERASAALVELGMHSISRGRDSSGLAFANSTGPNVVNDAILSNVSAESTNLQGVIVVKDTVPFDQFWGDDEAYMPILASAALTIGHTRAATQGNAGHRTNASPLAVGVVVGTHNGDINTRTVKNKNGQHESASRNSKNLFGETDTEVLYRAIDDCNSHRGKIVRILSKMHGRAALAWYDRRFPNRLYLARAALSPLAIAYDREGNFYWASNPNWFRKIDSKFDGALGFRDIRMVQEGTLMTIVFGEAEAEVVNIRRFKPIARHSDSYMPDSIIWRDFTDADKAADKQQKNHLVDAAPSYNAHLGSRMITTPNGTRYSTYPTYPIGASFSQTNDEVPEDLDEDEEMLCGEKEVDEYLLEATDEDIEAAIDAEIQWQNMIDSQDGVVPSHVLETLCTATDDKDFSLIAKDFGLPSVISARIFTAEVLDKESLAQSVAPSSS